MDTIFDKIKAWFPKRPKPKMNIIWKGSPNFTPGRKGWTPEIVVIHCMAGTLIGTDAWFNNKDSKVSAHYGVGLKGEIHGYVIEENTAFHCGTIHLPTYQYLKHANGVHINPNKYSIGIEFEGTRTSEWPDAMYEAGAELLADICRRNNIPLDRVHVIEHREINAKHDCPGKGDVSKLIQLAINKSLPV